MIFSIQPIPVDAVYTSLTSFGKDKIFDVAPLNLKDPLKNFNILFQCYTYVEYFLILKKF